MFLQGGNSQGVIFARLKSRGLLLIIRCAVRYMRGYREILT